MSLLVSFKHIKIGTVLLGVHFISVVLRATIKKTSKQMYLKTPLADNYSWELHVQGYQSLGRDSHLVHHLSKGLCGLGMEMPFEFFKSMVFRVTSVCM